MALPEDFLVKLRDASPIESIVSGYVKLRRTGRNLVGLCPFHGEKTPSFYLYPESDSFYCFGCGVGGDTITFIRRIENLDYIEAVKLLAQRAGLEMPEDGYRDDGRSKLKMRILEANREAARFFFSTLNSPVGAEALAYLRGRKLADSTIRHFGLGYAPDDWQALTKHLHAAGFRDNELIEANLVSRSTKSGRVYDRFRNRVIFPIIDVRGNVIAFSGRVLRKEDTPKYLNTAETLVFEKGAGLFALNFAKNSTDGKFILAEGPMDVIAMHQAGFTYAVATQGTALTPKQAMLIARYVPEVIVCYDADNAGQKATARAIPILKNAGLRVRVLNIPDGKDPDEFIKTHGVERFKRLVEDSGNDVEYRLSKIRAQYDSDTPDGRVNILREAVGLLASLQNTLECDIYAGKLASEFGVEKATILTQVEQQRRRKSREDQKAEIRQIQREAVSAGRDEVNPQRSQKIRAALAEEALIAYLLRNPDRCAAVRAKLPPEKFATDFNRGVYERLTDWVSEGHNVSISSFSDVYSLDEMGRISQIIAKNGKSTNQPEAEQDYIGVILSEYEKPSIQEIAEGSDAEILKYLEELKKKKQ